MKIKGLGWTVWFFFILYILARLTPIVTAHGLGKAQLVNAPSGSYLVSVWTDPDPARMGQLHVTVALAMPETQAPILEAYVIVQLSSLVDESVALTAAATHDNATNKLLYEAAFELPIEGQWQGTVSVTGPDGPGDVTFEMSVLPPAPVNWGLIGAVAAGLLVFGWLVWSWRQKPQERPLKGRKSAAQSTKHNR